MLIFETILILRCHSFRKCLFSKPAYFQQTDSVWIRILHPPFLPSANSLTRASRTLSPFSLITQQVEMTYQNGKSFFKRNLSVILILICMYCILCNGDQFIVTPDLQPLLGQNPFDTSFFYRIKTVFISFVNIEQILQDITYARLENDVINLPQMIVHLNVSSYFKQIMPQLCSLFSKRVSYVDKFRQFIVPFITSFDSFGASMVHLSLQGAWFFVN